MMCNSHDRAGGATLEELAEASRDALGMLRAAARGDDRALTFCVAYANCAPLSLVILTRWFASFAASHGHDPEELAAELSREHGLT